ncbi:MAG: hypothetical protein ACR2OO_14620 [Thermomicrobiales bacterium]
MNGMTRDIVGQLHSRRRAILAPLALAGMLAVGGAAPALAQTATPGAAEAAAGAATTISVTGFGEASIVADGGIMQLIMHRAGAGGQSGNANAGTADAAAQPLPPTSGEVAPVRQALLDAGIDKGAIRVVLPPGSPFSGAFAAGAAVVNAQIDAAQLKGVVKLLRPALKAAADNGLIVDAVNMAYLIADCAGVERAATANAVVDGTAQAASVAAALKVTLGPLTQVSKQSVYGSYGGQYGGGTSLCAQPATLESAKTSYLGTFDPAHGAGIDIYAQVLMVFATA